MTSNFFFGITQALRARLSYIPFVNKFAYFRYFAINSLDIEIEKILNYKNGYFIEIGANNGIKQSNTFYFENFKDWHGLLIEPHPKLFHNLSKNRARKSICVNAACVSFLFNRETINMIYSDLMTTSIEDFNILSNAKDHAYLGSKFMFGRPKDFSAIPKTMQQILEEVDAPKRIDLLSLDVEGSEFEVLAGIDHSVFRFNLICVETSDIPKMIGVMNKFGYRLRKQVTHHDLFFVDKYFQIQ